ncbi:gfo/Idh/MocA family oxidoreductase [Desertihabitans brevis]|uniref:Gfo/Idh/MocA family oxidoreductase n=1 Tax=Desertihabitans brevis TaxID=2268447 RepID=A0A367YTL2_9ACTN|nr:Gfo/Idh/MocA family oxidoreductase [Desertihabitans brevis]RCK68321.1 gfo/Idh/MocA family oxidoreductase [Desertihabitans brevis]
MSAPLRVAVLSFWHVHADDYSRRAQEHPATELVAVWDDDRDRGQEAAERLGVEFVADLPTLLGRDDIDAVTVTAPTAVHRDLIVAAAEAGKHVFTEKLLAPTVSEAEEVVAAAERHQVALVVSLPRLYHGYTAAIQDVLAEGRLGRLTHGRVRLSHGGAVRNWLPERFYDPETAIGGALTDLGCHPVYLLQLFLGARPDSVSATYRAVTGRAVEDHAVVVAGYPDQSIGVAEAGFVGRTPFTIELSGTEGSLRYSDAEDGVVVTDADGRHVLEVGPDGPDAFDQWVGHITHGTRAEDNLERAVELTRLVVLANRSAAEDRAIHPAEQEATR